MTAEVIQFPERKQRKEEKRMEAWNEFWKRLVEGNHYSLIGGEDGRREGL